MLFVLAWLILTNLLAFAMFAADKRAAIAGRSRTPEDKLLLISLLGGSAGAYAAQEVFRHKTRKQPFRTKFWMIVVFQAVVGLGWLIFRLPLPG